MYKVILKTAFSVIGCSLFFMLASKAGRQKLRYGVARLLDNEAKVWRELESAQTRLAEAFLKKKKQLDCKTSEDSAHAAPGSGSKCHTHHDLEYCNDFYANVETSCDVHRCESAHNNGDLSKQLGNATTFDQTTCA